MGATTSATQARPRPTSDQLVNNVRERLNRYANECVAEGTPMDQCRPFPDIVLDQGWPIPETDLGLPADGASVPPLFRQAFFDWSSLSPDQQQALGQMADAPQGGVDPLLYPSEQRRTGDVQERLTRVNGVEGWLRPKSLTRASRIHPNPKTPAEVIETRKMMAEIDHEEWWRRGIGGGLGALVGGLYGFRTGRGGGQSIGNAIFYATEGARLGAFSPTTFIDGDGLCSWFDQTGRGFKHDDPAFGRFEYSNLAFQCQSPVAVVGLTTAQIAGYKALGWLKGKGGRWLFNMAVKRQCGASADLNKAWEDFEAKVAGSLLNRPGVGGTITRIGTGGAFVLGGLFAVPHALPSLSEKLEETGGPALNALGTTAAFYGYVNFFDIANDLLTFGLTAVGPGLCQPGGPPEEGPDNGEPVERTAPERAPEPVAAERRRIDWKQVNDGARKAAPWALGGAAVVATVVAAAKIGAALAAEYGWVAVFAP